MKHKTDIISTSDFLNIRKPKRKNKYGNNKVTVDGKTFDSKLEAMYYEQLKIRQKANDINDFKLQPRYILQKPFKKGKRNIRKIEYIADFEIHHNDGSIEVIDVKGKKTDVFRLKEKLFHWVYPYKLTIIERHDF